MIIKLLLIPSYRSTDFDVHRNWLAITRHLPLSTWYFDDVGGTTVHTLDYPPSFAYFEYFLSNNLITKFLIESEILNERCFQLLGDQDNDVGMDCVVFQRLTVILVGDMVYLWGVLAMCQAFHSSYHTWIGGRSMEKKKRGLLVESMWVVMILAVFNSGLVLLDHVHFQYNGMLLGILLLSISFVLRSIMTLEEKSKTSLDDLVLASATTMTISTKMKRELIGCLLFVWLVTFKHLYMTLGPVYLFYMLGRVCQPTTRAVVQGGVGGGGQCWKWKNGLRFFLLLAVSVLLTVILPFIPFLVSDPVNYKRQLMQMLSRLFPFHQRGLCHNYWAGNVWALYMFVEKVCKKVLDATEYPTENATLFKVTPFIAAIFLLFAMIPAMICSWIIARKPMNYSPHQHQHGFLYCIVYASMTSFMLSYHVHEKAIMTAIVPMIFLSVTDRTSARLFLRMSTLGHFGLLPLLHKPTELLLKILLHSCYLVLSITLLEKIHHTKSLSSSGICSMLEEENIGSAPSCPLPVQSDLDTGPLLKTWDKIGLGMMAFILLYTESLHFVIFGHDKMEFLPLLITSVFCAVGLIMCWFQCGLVMLHVTLKPTVASRYEPSSTVQESPHHT